MHVSIGQEAFAILRILNLRMALLSCKILDKLFISMTILFSQRKNFPLFFENILIF
jgi:hypothetical protein